MRLPVRAASRQPVLMYLPSKRGCRWPLTDSLPSQQRCPRAGSCRGAGQAALRQTGHRRRSSRGKAEGRAQPLRVPIPWVMGAIGKISSHTVMVIACLIPASSGHRVSWAMAAADSWPSYGRIFKSPPAVHRFLGDGRRAFPPPQPRQLPVPQRYYARDMQGSPGDGPSGAAIRSGSLSTAARWRVGSRAGW